MRACKKCGCREFYGHQLVRMDVICTGEGFERNIHEDISTDIYDAEKPYGPFSCVDCGEQYDEYKDIPDIALLYHEEIVKALFLHIIKISEYDEDIVCIIDDNFFYISNDATGADFSAISADEYVKQYPYELIAKDILASLEGIRTLDLDEYMYYTLYISEQLRKMDALMSKGGKNE